MEWRLRDLREAECIAEKDRYIRLVRGRKKRGEGVISKKGKVESSGRDMGLEMSKRKCVRNGLQV